MFLPLPSSLQCLLKGALSSPAKLLICKCCICPYGNNVARATRGYLVVEFEVIDPLKGLDKLKDRHCATCADVENLVVAPIFTLNHAVNSCHMCFGKVYDVNIIS